MPSLPVGIRPLDDEHPPWARGIVRGGGAAVKPGAPAGSGGNILVFGTSGPARSHRSASIGAARGDSPSPVAK